MGQVIRFNGNKGVTLEGLLYDQVPNHMYQFFQEVRKRRINIGIPGQSIDVEKAYLNEEVDIFTNWASRGYNLDQWVTEADQRDLYPLHRITLKFGLLWPVPCRFLYLAAQLATLRQAPDIRIQSIDSEGNKHRTRV